MIFITISYYSTNIFNYQLIPLLNNIKDIYNDENNIIIIYLHGYTKKYIERLRKYNNSNFEIIIFDINNIVKIENYTNRNMNNIGKIIINIHYHGMNYIYNVFDKNKLIAFIDTDVLFLKNINNLINTDDNNDIYLSTDFYKKINTKKLYFNQGVFFCKNNKKSLKFHKKCLTIFNSKIDINKFKVSGDFDQHIFRYICYYNEKSENLNLNIDDILKHIRNPITISDNIKIKFYDLKEINYFYDDFDVDNTYVLHYKGLHQYLPDNNLKFKKIYKIWKRYFDNEI